MGSGWEGVSDGVAVGGGWLWYWRGGRVDLDNKRKYCWRAKVFMLKWGHGWRPKESDRWARCWQPDEFWCSKLAGGGLSSNPQGYPQGFPQSNVGGAVKGGAGPAGSQLAVLQGGGTPVGQPVMPAGTGDIVLNADGADKSRKGLVITLIVLVVLAIGAGVGFALWRGGVFGGGEDSGETVQDKKEDLRVAFNKFANYLYRGEASEEDFALDWNWKSASELKFMLDEDDDGDGGLASIAEEKKDFFNKSMELGKEFYAQLDVSVPVMVSDTESVDYKLRNIGDHIYDNFMVLYTVGVGEELGNVEEGEKNVLSEYEYRNDVPMSAVLAREMMVRLNSFREVLEELE